MTQLSVFLRHAKRSNNKELDLSYRELSFVPKEVFTIRTLQVLNLSNNKIAAIEPSITDLFRLKQLILDNNSLLELPRELLDLPKLCFLSLKGNPLNKKFSVLLNLGKQEYLNDILQECFEDKKNSSTTPSWLIEPETKNEKEESQLAWENSIFKRDKPFSASKNALVGRRANKSEKIIEVQPENQANNGVLEIKIQDLEIGEQISMGGFSTIHRGSYFDLDVAVKKVFNPNISEQLLKEFNNQITILAKYRHPNIVLMIGAVTNPPILCLVTELVKDGTLYDLLYKRKVALSDADKRKIVKQLINVLLYLHKHGIVHRDIKSHNVLTDKSYNIKLCDFGLAKHRSELNTGPQQFSGTPTYMAQELFLKRAFNESVDIFALGTLIYEIYSGQVPYQGLEPGDIKQKVLKDGNLPFKISVKKPVSEIINKCRSIQVEERPTITELSKFTEW